MSAPAPPWAHRWWCAPDCGFPPGRAEGTHLGRAWILVPEDEETSRVALRLVEEPGQDGPGEVAVLVSVTERRLAQDLDPWGESSEVGTGGPLADITSSAGLSGQEAGRVADQLVMLAALCGQGGSTAGRSRP